MAISTQNRESASGPPDIQDREHLRRLTAGLTLTRELIHSGAAAFTESVKLLNRLGGRAAAPPGPVDFAEGAGESSS